MNEDHKIALPFKIITMNTSLTKRITQFSLGAILLVVLWFAGSFAGYRRGFDRGYLAGQAKRAAEQPYWAVYDATAFLPEDFDAMHPNPDDFTLLMAHVMNLNVETWPMTGGDGKFHVAPYNQSFFVFNTSDTHEAISESLTDLAEADDPFQALNDAIEMPGTSPMGNATMPASP